MTAELADVRAIHELKARYFRCIDTKDWDGFAAVLDPEVFVDVSADGAGTFRDREAFLAMLIPMLDGVVTVHHGLTPEITLTSATTAEGIWAMEDRLWFPPASGLAELHGWGHYHDTYVKTDGEWRIRTMRLERLRIDLTALPTAGT